MLVDEHVTDPGTVPSGRRPGVRGVEPVARNSFDGEDGVTTHRDVTTGFLTADVARERAFARLLLSQSGSNGAYRAGATQGRIESTLVKGHLGAMCIDQQIRIDGDHAPGFR